MTAAVPSNRIEGVLNDFEREDISRLMVGEAVEGQSLEVSPLRKRSADDPVVSIPPDHPFFLHLVQKGNHIPSR